MNEEINATNNTTNEVARLRELLNRAIEIADEAITPLQRSEYSMDGDMLYRQLERLRDEVARLSAAPEEPYYPEQDLPTPDEEIAYAKSTEPVPEWRELGPDEVIDYCRKWAAEHLAGHGKETFYARLGLLVDFATDLYRDEIQKLKEAK
jgi:hypothetical protein